MYKFLFCLYCAPRLSVNGHGCAFFSGHNTEILFQKVQQVESTFGQSTPCFFGSFLLLTAVLYSLWLRCDAMLHPAYQMPPLADAHEHPWRSKDLFSLFHLLLSHSPFLLTLNHRVLAEELLKLVKITREVVKRPLKWIWTCWRTGWSSHMPDSIDGVIVEKGHDPQSPQNQEVSWYHHSSRSQDPKGKYPADPCLLQTPWCNLRQWCGREMRIAHQWPHCFATSGIDHHEHLSWRYLIHMGKRLKGASWTSFSTWSSLSTRTRRRKGGRNSILCKSKQCRFSADPCERNLYRSMKNSLKSQNIVANECDRLVHEHIIVMPSWKSQPVAVESYRTWNNRRLQRIGMSTSLSLLYTTC